MASDFPKVLNDDPALIRAEVIAEYEAETNKKLYPAQSDNFPLNELAYRESLTKSQFNAANKQNYVRWATGTLLEALGEFWGVWRLPEEKDDKFRIRILLAPESLTSTGTRGAYEFFIRSVDPIISAVSFDNPNPGSGTVRSYILTDNGLPTEELLARVYQKVTSTEIMVMGVAYEVKAPEIVYYDFKFKVVVAHGYDKQSIKKQVLIALQGIADEDGNKVQDGFIDTLQKTLGHDVVLSQFTEVIQKITGVHSVTIETPTADINLTAGQWPVNRSVEVTVVEQSEDR